MKAVAQCKVCNKSLNSEEIEIGTSLVCPRCDPKSDIKLRPEAEDRCNSNVSTEES